MEPENGLDETFAVRSYESGVSNRVSLPTLCNYMQEIAGLSAEKLGWGILKLQEEKCTWMLSRLHVKVERHVPWGEAVVMRTWPSGMKGRLLATRCFQAMSGKGEGILQAYSEWLYVNMETQKIAKLPDSFAALVPEGTPSIEFADLGGKFPKLPAVETSAPVLVRKSDLDFNDHVNNVHYIEWMLETATVDSVPSEIDITYRSAAKYGDALLSEQCSADGRTLHQIRRESDNQILATAAIKWL